MSHTVATAAGLLAHVTEGPATPANYLCHVAQSSAPTSLIGQKRPTRRYDTSYTGSEVFQRTASVPRSVISKPFFANCSEDVISDFVDIRKDCNTYNATKLYTGTNELFLKRGNFCRCFKTRRTAKMARMICGPSCNVNVVRCGMQSVIFIIALYTV